MLLVVTVIVELSAVEENDPAFDITTPLLLCTLPIIIDSIAFLFNLRPLKPPLFVTTTAKSLSESFNSS